MFSHVILICSSLYQCSYKIFNFISEEGDSEGKILCKSEYSPGDIRIKSIAKQCHTGGCEGRQIEPTVMWAAEESTD